MSGPKPTLAGLCEQINRRREAVAYVQRLQREAWAVKRTVGQMRNPFQAVSGLEAEFKEADKVARCCDFILNEIEKKPRRKREMRGFFNAVTRRATDYVIILGLAAFVGIGLGMVALGIAVASKMLFGLVLPRWAFALAFPALVALAAVVVELWKRGGPRK